MKSTAIDVLIICLIAIPLLIGAYMHYFLYWDEIMSPKQKFIIYWHIYVPIVIGYAISVFRKKW